MGKKGKRFSKREFFQEGGTRTVLEASFRKNSVLKSEKEGTKVR